MTGAFNPSKWITTAEAAELTGMKDSQVFFLVGWLKRADEWEKRME